MIVLGENKSSSSLMNCYIVFYTLNTNNKVVPEDVSIQNIFYFLSPLKNVLALD